MNGFVLPTFSLNGKLAIITGASRGIGEEIANVCAAAGARVVVCSRKQDAIEQAAARIRERGGDALAVVANVSLPDDRRKLVEAAMSWGSRIDILVNNAGTNPAYGPLAAISEDVWDKTFETNVKAPLFLSQLVYQASMKERGGVILNIASVGGYLCTRGINVYNITKAALIHLTRCLAVEWGPDGVRVNALAPGLIKTEFSRALWESARASKVVMRHPIPRLGDTSDLAGAALFLVSDAAAFITGHILVVDGGRILAAPDLTSEETA